MASLFDLSSRRPPTTYMLEITHHWDGRIEAFVHDISDSDKSQSSVWFALCELATKHMTDEQINAAILHRIDGLMGSCHGTDDNRKLSLLADASVAIESFLYPMDTDP